MNYKEAGFRAFYHNFCVLPITKSTKAALENFPGADSANGVLTYGYYDREMGLTLEVVAAAHVDGESASFEDSSDSIRSMLRIDAVDEDDFLFFADEEGKLAERYADRLEFLHNYDAGEDVEKTREMSFLDECRHETHIDDILVYLVKEGLQLEGCWTRITGLGDHYFIGTLLNEPNQDFGYHRGETIAFFVRKMEDEKIICFSDMNPSQKLTAADLEDGSMLEHAVERFVEERNEENFITVLEILRDSLVWIPCNAVVSEADQAQILKMLEESNGDLEALKGQEFSTVGDTRLIPDILQRDGEFFFPVFSTVEAMGEYGNNFSKVQKHMLEAIGLARNNEKKPEKIVLNAFSEPFIFDKEIWDLVEKMKSRISE